MTACPQCGRPAAGRDHVGGGCPYVTTLGPAGLLTVDDRIAPAWWQAGAMVEIDVENIRGVQCLVVRPHPNRESDERLVLTKKL